MYGQGMYMDPMYFVFVLPAFLLTMWAQQRIRSTYNKWAQVGNERGLTGADVARTLLPSERMSDISLEVTPGQLSDHYDPQKNVLRLSPAVAEQPSIASMSIAAHEIGHAAQDRDGYLWMKVRSGLVPVLSLASTLGYLIFGGGLFLQSSVLAWIGVLMISGSAIFSLVTLPVELDASNRALKMLSEHSLITSPQEQKAAREMLNSAAWTYVAGAAQAIAGVLYYVFAIMGRSNRRR
ncbi:MAG: zinc metallopeptidase [Anaerolineae bacterium]|nr:zinc metallopeptidase [Anaerolineae bacterium]